eukprot:3600589-Rhodomonas_salina.2
MQCESEGWQTLSLTEDASESHHDQPRRRLRAADTASDLGVTLRLEVQVEVEVEVEFEFEVEFEVELTSGPGAAARAATKPEPSATLTPSGTGRRDVERGKLDGGIRVKRENERVEQRGNGRRLYVDAHSSGDWGGSPFSRSSSETETAAT